MMHNISRNWLKKLLQKSTLPASSVPKIAQADVSNLLSLGFLCWEKSGSGGIYRIQDSASIQNLLNATGYDGELENLTPKARAVALHGDAHKGRDTSLLLFLACASQQTPWSNGNIELNVFENVVKYGVAALLVYPGDNWETHQPIILVENLDLVLNAREYYKNLEIEGTVLFYSGWLSKKLLDWLTEKKRAPSYLIMPDYDIVGIKNYLKAKEHLGESLDIYIPDNLPTLLKKCGSAKKLESKASRTMIETSNDKKAQKLYNILLQIGKTVDQESLLLYQKQNPRD